MKKFNVKITTTIESEIEVYANDYAEVEKGLVDDIWRDEINDAQMQWNVTDEHTFIDEADEPKVVRRWARKCDATGEGMNEGYVYGDGQKYFKYEKDLIAYIRDGADESFNDATDEFILNEAYELDEYYWTEWESPEDDEWDELEDGTLRYDENV